MAMGFAQIYFGSIGAAYDEFCSWNFGQKMGKSYAKAVYHTQTNHGILDHHAPFPVAPIAPTIILPVATVFAA